MLDRKNLRSLVHQPVVVVGRGVLRCPGYSAENEIYADFNADEFDLREVSTREQIVQDVRQLWRPWSAYQFATEHDRAAMLAAIIGAICRPSLGIAPGLCFDAPTPSSGKTIAATAIGSLILGRHCPVVIGAKTNDDDEMRKLVASAVLSGTDVLILDNLRGHVCSAVLEGLITSGGLYGRILGQTQPFEGEVRGTIMLTSNNASLSTDMATRFLQIRIDTRTERPQSQHFEFHPLVRVLCERLAIINAVLNVVQAYFDAGSPVIGKGCSRFPEWDRLVRQCVLWLKREGFAKEAGIDQIGDPAHAIMEDAGNADPESEGLALLLEGLQSKYGAEWFSARSAVSWIENCRDDNALMVREAVETLMPSIGCGRISVSTFASILRYRVDRPSEGLVLRKFKAGKKTNGYMVCRHAGA